MRLAAVRKERGPDYDRQRVTGKAAGRTVHGAFGDVAVNGEQRIDAGGGQ